MPGEIFVRPYHDGILAICSICDGTILGVNFPDFDPQTATECPLCGNPNKPEEKTDV